jgi:hypothetical protein
MTAREKPTDRHTRNTRLWRVKQSIPFLSFFNTKKNLYKFTLFITDVCNHEPEPDDEPLLPDALYPVTVGGAKRQRPKFQATPNRAIALAPIR